MAQNTFEEAARLLGEMALVVDPDHDQVAVAKVHIPAHTRLIWRECTLTVQAGIPAGHRFALSAIPAGEWVRQYGQPFARSRGLQPGDPINDDTVDNAVPLNLASQKIKGRVFADGSTRPRKPPF
ncbi:MAG: hypothetical protein JXA21_17545 [Anaerolineae bacterium]|nr:hypothetical protein [Anaerolineae bacterium]